APQIEARRGRNETERLAVPIDHGILRDRLGIAPRNHRLEPALSVVARVGQRTIHWLRRRSAVSRLCPIASAYGRIVRNVKCLLKLLNLVEHQPSAPARSGIGSLLDELVQL